MQFTWIDIYAVADALQDQHPDADRLGISRDELIALVRGLEGFNGPPEPPEADSLELIRSAWIAADPPDEDGRFDFAV